MSSTNLTPAQMQQQMLLRQMQQRQLLLQQQQAAQNAENPAKRARLIAGTSMPAATLTSRNPLGGANNRVNNTSMPSALDKKIKNAKSKNPLDIAANRANAIGVLTDYLEKNRRPFSVQNLFDNLRGEIPKKLLQELLDTSGEFEATVFRY